MPDVVTFDADNLRIIEVDTGLVVNEIDATEIYSEWKDWLLADASRLGHPVAFTPVGGDSISSTRDLGTTRFLENCWRLRAAEYDHKWVVSGNLYTREEGESIFVATLGSYNVHTETVVSNIIDQVSASGGSGGQDEVSQGWANDPEAGILRAAIALHESGEFVELGGSASVVLEITDEEGSSVHTSGSVTPESDGIFHYEFEYIPVEGTLLRSKATVRNGSATYVSVALIAVM